MTATTTVTTPTTTLKLTELEIDVLDGCYRSEYTGGGNDFGIWSWSCAPRKTGVKQLSGVVASLVKKGLVTCGGNGTKDDDSTIDATPLGIEVARALGFFTVQPDGDEWYNPDHADAFRPEMNTKVVDKTYASDKPSDKVSVRLGHGIVEVLQLDDAGNVKDYGLEIDFSKKSFITVIGTRSALAYFSDCCQNRISSQYDQPLWYMSAAKAAMVKINAALEAK